MSRLFLARDTKSSELRVLKTLAEDPRSDPELTERLLQEGAALAVIKEEFVVHLHEVTWINGWPFLVLEYCNGGSLIEYFRAAQTSLSSDLTILLEIVLGMLSMTSRLPGLLHRDLKPGNILLKNDEGKEPHALIADLGIVTQNHTKARHTASIALRDMMTVGSIGTPQYMSPEQFVGEPELDARSDIYSYGLIAFEMLARKKPYLVTKEECQRGILLRTGLKPIRRSAKHLDRRIASLVDKCLDVRPKKRFAGWEELLEEWLRIACPLESVDSPKSRFERKRVGFVAPNLRQNLQSRGLVPLPTAKGQKVVQFRADMSYPATLARAEQLSACGRSLDALAVLSSLPLLNPPFADADAVISGTQEEPKTSPLGAWILRGTVRPLLIPLLVRYIVCASNANEEDGRSAAEIHSSSHREWKGTPKGCDQFNEAACHAARVLAKHASSDARALALSAQPFIHTFRFQEADKFLVQAERIAPDDEYVYKVRSVLLARLALAHQSKAETTSYEESAKHALAAIEAARTCATREPQSASAWFNLGLALWGAGLNADAVEPLRRAVTLGHPRAEKALRHCEQGDRVVVGP